MCNFSSFLCYRRLMTELFMAIMTYDQTLLALGNSSLLKTLRSKGNVFDLAIPLPPVLSSTQEYYIVMLVLVSVRGYSHLWVNFFGKISIRFFFCLK